MTAAPKRHKLMLFAAGYAGSAFLQKGIGFFLFMWLAHSLSVQDYARFGLFYALQSGVAALAVAGIAEAVIGMLKDHAAGAARQRLFASANALFALLTLGACALSVLVWLLLAGSIGAGAFDIACLTVAGALTGFFTLQSLLTRLNEQHVASLWLNSLPPLVGLGTGWLAFLLAPSVSSFYAGMAAGLALVVLLFPLVGARFHGFVPERAMVRALAGRLGPFMLIVALAWFSGYGNTYLVNAMFEASDVARFTFAYTLSSVMQLLASSLNQVWSPRFFAAAHTSPVAELEQGNRRFYLIMGAVLGLAGALALVAAPLAVRLVGASLAPYAGLELPLFFLFAAYAVSMPWWHAQNYYLAHSQGPQLMYVSVATSVAGLVLWLGAMAWLGSIGVYVGFALMMLARSVGAFAFARRVWPLRLMWEATLLALALQGAGLLLALQLR